MLEFLCQRRMINEPREWWERELREEEKWK
jgi:hypothetical protein